MVTRTVHTFPRCPNSARESRLSKLDAYKVSYSAAGGEHVQQQFEPHFRLAHLLGSHILPILLTITHFKISKTFHKSYITKSQLITLPKSNCRLDTMLLYQNIWRIMPTWHFRLYDTRSIDWFRPMKIKSQKELQMKAEAKSLRYGWGVRSVSGSRSHCYR